MLEGATPVPSQLLVHDDRIEAISRGRRNALDGADAEVIDLGGALVTPGMVDLHVHLREPGQEHKDLGHCRRSPRRVDDDLRDAEHRARPAHR